MGLRRGTIIPMFYGGKMKYVMALALSLALATGAFAAPAPQSATAATKKSTKKKKASAPASEVTRRLDEMQQSISTQQQQIQQLGQELRQRDAVIQQLQQHLDQSQAAVTEAASKAESAASEANKQSQTVTALQGDVTDLKQNSTNVALSLQETQKSISSLESPLALHYKGVTITPVAFLAAETVWRHNATGSDVNTPFNSIPFPGSSASHLSEFFGSGRQSRVGMLAEGKLKDAKLTGYVEADFLSAGVTSNSNQSNSYTLRQRQAWGQAALTNGLTLTGGQMWSLVTETKSGVDNRSEALPMTIDPQYNVGFSWARQFGFRVSKSVGKKMWLAFSVENPQTTVGGEGARNNFVIGAAGTGGGLYNPSATYSFNQMPDFIGKIAFQPNKVTHVEVFGVISRFRDRVFPGATNTTPTAAGAYNDASMAGGAGANFRTSLANKHLDVGIHFLGGDGVGRYGTSTLPDVFVRPDGVLVPIRSYQALGTLEYHAKKLDIYTNVGGEYADRNSLSATSAIGYGSPLRTATGCSTETVPGTPPTSGTGGAVGTFPVTTVGFLPGGLGGCNVDTRNLIEGTIGFWYRFYNGPKGRIQWGPQFSYLVKNTWRGVGGSPSANEPMVFTSFRYYLP
jgi:hypothetical protein